VKKKMNRSQVVVYQGPTGALELKADAGKETVWATLNQIAELFETDKSGISRHINNILKTDELPGATVAKYATVQNEGGREVSRQIEYYSLDCIIALGYRINSKRATQFRMWATQRLRPSLKTTN